jgi:thiol-disulfide isomerase/thioredoxin
MSNIDTGLIFSLYSRPECHLCDDMLDALKEWQKQFKFEVKVFNIDDNQELTTRYAARIPLLAINDTEICEYFFDEKSFLQALKNNK